MAWFVGVGGFLIREMKKSVEVVLLCASCGGAIFGFVSSFVGLGAVSGSIAYDRPERDVCQVTDYFSI
jgi:hypothetical protein